MYLGPLLLKIELIGALSVVSRSKSDRTSLSHIYSPSIQTHRRQKVIGALSICLLLAVLITLLPL